MFLYSLRPRASSSSSQSERSASPLVMNSTQSLDVMPRFAISAEEEGKIDKHVPLHILPSCCYRTPVLMLYLLVLDGMVSNLRRIRLRSNSTGTRPSFRRGASRRIAHQLETPEKPRSTAGKVPKSASVSGLSLIITPGTPDSNNVFQKMNKSVSFTLSLVLIEAIASPAAIIPVLSSLLEACHLSIIVEIIHVFTVPSTAYCCVIYTRNTTTIDNNTG